MSGRYWREINLPLRDFNSDCSKFPFQLDWRHSLSGVARSGRKCRVQISEDVDVRVFFIGLSNGTVSACVVRNWGKVEGMNTQRNVIAT